MRAWVSIFLMIIIIDTDFVTGIDTFGGFDKIFEISNAFSYYNYLGASEIQEKGTFKITLSLIQTTSSFFNFSFYNPFPVLTISNPNNTGIFENSSGQQIYGWLKPRQEISVTHQINLCMSDTYFIASYYFNITGNKYTKFHLSLDILTRGRDTCPPQIGPSLTDLNFIIPIIFAIVFFVILILLTNKKPPKYKPKSDDLYPENKRGL